MVNSLRRIASVFFCASLSLAAARAEPPPVSAFTAFAKYDDLVVSPDGKRLALTQRDGDRHLLTFVNYPKMDTARTISYGDWVDIDGMRWIDNDVLLFQPARLFIGLTAYKAPTGEIARVNAATGRSELIFGFLAGKKQTGTRVAVRDSVYAAGSLLSRRTTSSNEVLIQTLGDRDESTAAYRMNLESGLLAKVVGSPVAGARFIVGADYQPVLAYGTTVTNDIRVWKRGDGINWVQASQGSDKLGGLLPLGWTGKGEEFYALDNIEGPTDGVSLWDAATDSRRALYRNPATDLRPLGVDSNARIWGFVGTNHFPVYWYPDPEHPLAKLHGVLVQKFPRHAIGIASTTDDMKVSTVRLSSAEQPPAFLVVETETAKILQYMPTYPELKPEAMASVDPIEFRARDGLAIRGYLTTPKGADGKLLKKLPTIVMVHGGPHGPYDDYGWDFERQLFASRGYAVLQVNFRGSGGRGREFEQAGYGKWGREMQDDVTDGVRWAIGDGVADAKRICIYGGSYGAYSALTGAFREPELFQCAVGMAGVYDLALMFERGDIQSHARGMNYLKDVLGEDKDELRMRSPTQNAAAIKAKVLLIHGKDDPRAPFVHAERLRKALIQAGNPPEWLADGGESHGIFDPKNRVEAWETMLAFFEKNIGH